MAPSSALSLQISVIELYLEHKEEIVYRVDLITSPEFLHPPPITAFLL